MFIDDLFGSFVDFLELTGQIGNEETGWMNMGLTCSVKKQKSGTRNQPFLKLTLKVEKISC